MASWLADEASKFAAESLEYVTCLAGGGSGPATADASTSTREEGEADYAGDGSWWLANPVLGVVGAELCVPMQTVPPGSAVDCAAAAGAPRADVFFVHGTLASAQDGPAGDGNYDCRATLPAATKGYVLSQASCFNAVARVFAPHYRYAAFVGEDTRRGLALDARHDFAYGDVSRAFDAFLGASGARPFFLAGHSQGAIMVARLLRERVGSDAALRRRLVGAYAPGLALFEATANLPVGLADTPGAVGTLACWNCAADKAAFEHTTIGALCGGHRPLTAVPFLDKTTRARQGHPGCFGWGAFFAQVFYTEACTALAVDDGLLRVTGDAALLAFYATGTGCMHKWDFHLLWLDVRKNALLQLAAYEQDAAAPPPAVDASASS